MISGDVSFIEGLGEVTMDSVVISFISKSSKMVSSGL